MTVIGTGGVQLRFLDYRKKFHRELRKLPQELRDRVCEKLNDLLKDPRPSGLGFEKLQGHARPDIYTIHVTGNYKISFEIGGDTAILRRVASHDEIDRAP